VLLAQHRGARVQTYPASGQSIVVPQPPQNSSVLEEQNGAPSRVVAHSSGWYHNFRARRCAVSTVLGRFRLAFDTPGQADTPRSSGSLCWFYSHTGNWGCHRWSRRNSDRRRNTPYTPHS
jgi:hypothetical protein